MDEIRRSKIYKKAKKFSFISNNILFVFIMFRMILLILFLISHIIRISQIKGGFSHDCYSDRI